MPRRIAAALTLLAALAVAEPASAAAPLGLTCSAP
jgi:hypothetical protein